MYSTCEELESQVSRLHNTLAGLRNQSDQLNERLGHQGDNADLQSQMRQLLLDIRITENELEDAHGKLEQCKKATA